ncbi:MAG: hypothetical protein JW790_04820 [Dehalococcoidales bacterium]|nr:hypothetical protein [Dehalococcoidales bacterium]
MNLNDWIELIKSSVRPFIIIWGFMVYGICVMTGVEVPQLLAGLVTAVVLEYFGERAYQRLREKEE